MEGGTEEGFTVRIKDEVLSKDPELCVFLKMAEERKTIAQQAQQLGFHGGKVE